MFLLVFVQNSDETPLVIFESIEAGRSVVQDIPGYTKKEYTENCYHITHEYFDLEHLPNYMELEYNGNRIPITKFMFRDKDNVDIIWREIPNMETPNQGLIDGQTLVDAYIVDNNELREYIIKREKAYDRVKAFLEKLGYDVDRDYQGSEDGEAIVYKKNNENEWHFLTHIDPMFIDDIPNEKRPFEKWVEGLLV